MPAKKKSLDFETSYDVVVCGGGVAGVAASLASARRGFKTCLIEKTVFPGGLATSGNVLIYLPISDKRNRQVTFGLSEELMNISILYGPGEAHAINDWSNGHRSVFNPSSFIFSLDEVLQRDGVDIWFDSLVCGARVSKGRLAGVEVENKSGRGLVNGKSFVDATGDADIAFRAGAPCATELNHMSIWTTGVTPELAKEVLSENGCDARRLLHTFGAWDDGTNHPGGVRKFSGVNSKDVSEFILVGRNFLRKKFKQYQSEHEPNGRSKVFPVGLPAMADFRTTRRIESLHDLGNGDHSKHFEDCTGIVPEWKRGEELWELPYRTLLPQKVKGLLAAGRCIGTRDDAWSTFRVIQSAAMSGEVAGLAASMSVERGINPDRLDVGDLQSELKKRSFLLDVRELN